MGYKGGSAIKNMKVYKLSDFGTRESVDRTYVPFNWREHGYLKIKESLYSLHVHLCWQIWRLYMRFLQCEEGMTL